MFDIGFSELLLVFVIGLIVLGPQRLPVAVKTVAGWIRALRSLATTVQNELTQELKLQEFQDSLKKVEKASNLTNLTPELKASMDELREAAESMKRSYGSALNSTETASAESGTPATADITSADVDAVNGEAQTPLAAAASVKIEKQPEDGVISVNTQPTPVANAVSAELQTPQAADEEHTIRPPVVTPSTDEKL